MLGFVFLFVDQAVSGKTSSNAERTEDRASQNKKRQDTLKRLAKLKVSYVAPAGGVDANFRKEYLKDIRKFGVSIPNEAFVNKNICRFSDTDSNRLLRLKHSINSDSKIIWAMRGGFGSYKLINSLKNLPDPKKKKVLIGFSDITALNLYVSQNWKNWTVIHAPMIVHLAKDQYHHPSWNMLLDILENKISQYKMTVLSPLNKAGEKAKIGKIRGKLTGGNLTLIESGLKTSWEIDTDDKILFIEDCHETAPSIYRSMHHLKEAGKLSKAKAIIFGHFVGVSEYKKYLKHFASESNIPMFITDQFGHGKNNLPLVYNADGCIEGNSLTVKLPRNR
ncbi:MAG: LD-carboxypeptidase [Alphaproteobacteria bacterium]|nr:LD-carboxypeptidase [Alphaproteobacteria bacterium]